jgi:glycogen synthase
MGGVETHVFEVSRRLTRAGVETTVLTADSEGQLPEAEAVEGVTVHRVRAWPAGSDLYFAPAIFRVIGEGDWDIVHVQSYHTFVAPFAMLAARRAGIPYVVTFHPGGHSSAWRNRLRGAQHRLLRPLFAGAARLIAVAPSELDLFGDRLGIDRARFAYIPNGCDITPVAPRAPAAPDGTLIASIGRLERYKGHHRVIAALPHILERLPGARLWIAGSGPFAAELNKLAQALGVADQVSIRAIPPEERERMAAELGQAAVVTLLSAYETHPIAVLEAAALGRPILVADSPGLRELAEQGLARSISLASSAEEIAAAIVEQVRNPLYPPALHLPSWDDCTAALLSLYRNVAGQAYREAFK